jgi:toxin ParE1/3/4
VNDVGRAWPVHLTAAADADIEQAIRWSARQFGVRQARAYAQTLTMALEALMRGPGAIGVKDRADIGKALMSLHVARAGRKGRHVVIFRIRRRAGHEVVEVLRVLHDSMDLPRHLPPA